ncbi:peptidylprolyl isomerase [Devosia sp.]|uniref:peptidylprolyl isomerase n=1 Tax=Devosia sp. TaxID=1871048 RepID=UPI003265F025
MSVSMQPRRTVLGALAFAFVAVFVGAAAFPTAAQAQTGTPHLLLELKKGTVDIELEPNLAPAHVAQIVALAEKGEYDGVVFHRVIEGFMAQTGDVKYGKTGAAGFDLANAGMGGSDLPDIKAEFSNEPFVRGTVGAARSQDPNSANSQFFIMYADGSFLNGQYTVFGKVVSGMEFVDALEKGPADQNGAVANPDMIVKATVEYK